MDMKKLGNPAMGTDILSEGKMVVFRKWVVPLFRPGEKPWKTNLCEKAEISTFYFPSSLRIAFCCIG